MNEWVMNNNINSVIEMSKPKLIAFYLPQYHPTLDNDNGGERDLRNGRMLEKRSRYLLVIINLKFPLI